jgi:carbohydrate diacid regulator
MELSKQNAMKIVTEISDIIGQHVNMMDEHGTIIASTDPERVGTFHGGAAALIRSRSGVLVIDDDAQFEGSRKGINLPLMLNDTWVGVLGVTGEYREVLKYGQVIKKMTEAMLLENYMHQQKKIDDRIRDRFLDEWILDGVPITADMIERGARLDIDVHMQYRVIVTVIADLRRYSDTPEGQMMIDNINRHVRSTMEATSHGIFTKTATKMICLLPRACDGAMTDKAASILEDVGRRFGVALYAGIDGRAQSVHLGYRQASKAVQACAGGKRICLYDAIGLEIFMDEVPINSRMAFVQRVFRDCDEKETSAWVEMLKVYFDTNGSISQTADRLFIHKNTLQYKLHKLYEKTGYDPRKLPDSALIYLAMQFLTAVRNAQE